MLVRLFQRFQLGGDHPASEGMGVTVGEIARARDVEEAPD